MLDEEIKRHNAILQLSLPEGYENLAYKSLSDTTLTSLIHAQVLITVQGDKLSKKNKRLSVQVGKVLQ